MEKAKGLKNKQTKNQPHKKPKPKKNPTTLNMKIYRYLIGKCIF